MTDVRLGQHCIYRPRVPYGRQSELFCFITRIVREDEGVVDLIAFPANSEIMHINNVAQRSEAIGIHCWEAAEEKAGAAIDEATVKAIVEAVTKDLVGKLDIVSKTNSELVGLLDTIEKRLAAIEKRPTRQPGGMENAPSPPKPAAQ